MNDAEKFLISTSLSDEIVSVETWDFVSGSNSPSFTVYPSLFVVSGVQITPSNCAGISVKLQLISWSSTVYTFVVAGSILTAGI